MNTKLHVLIVEDSESDAGLIVRHLERGGYAPVHERVATASAMKAALEKGPWDIVIADYKMPQFGAPAALNILKESGLDVPFIVVSGTIGEVTAVAMMKAGAQDYMMKDSLARLVPAVERELRESQVRREHKQADKALREKEARIQSITRAAPTGIAVVSNRVLLEVNNRFCEMLGYSENELIGNSTRLLYTTDDDFEHAAMEVYSQIEAKGTASTETRFRHKDGSIIEVLLSSTMVAPSDIYPELNLTVLDITERKRAEEALRESEQRYRILAENATDIIWTLDLNLRFTYASPSVEKQQGWTVEELKSFCLQDILTPDSLDKVMKAFEEELSLEKMSNIDPKRSRTLELEEYRKDGSTIWIEVTASFLRDNEGNAIGIMGISRDITERKHMEQASRASEIRYRTIFENTGTAMIIAEEDMIISLSNAEFERLIGYSRDEIEGKMKWTDFVTADKLEEMKEFIQLRRIDTHAALKSYEISIRDKEGDIRHVFITVTMMPETKQSVASIIDITERKKLQTQFYQSQKMEAIGTLAGGIAHDFNNILSGIMGYTELLLTKHSKEDQLRNYLERVYQAGDRARSLVKQILTISRRVEQELQPMHIGPIIGEVLKLLRSSLPTTIEIRQDIEISPEESIIVADPTQIYQVMMNICTNAAHAMRAKGGVLSVYLSKVDVDPAMVSRIQDLHVGPHVKLTVSDTGHGIDADVMERIFEPYFTTKGTGEGTGLGLAIVQGIVKSYGGAITIYSESGKGTTFDILLPSIKQDIAERIESTEALPTGNERILFIDDEEMMADLGYKILESLGYTVTAKTSSLEALEVFRIQPGAYDLVITDMTMPGMTGIDLAKALMAIRTDMPIILCTGYSDLINAEQAKEAGISDFIMKPFMIARLAKGIRQVLEKK